MSIEIDSRDRNEVVSAGDREMTESSLKTDELDHQSDSQREEAAAAIFKKYWGRRKLVVRLLDFLLRPLAWFLPSTHAPGLDEVKTILVFEPGSLGDMVMLMPFLKSLRMRFPVAQLSLLCRTGGEKGYASLDYDSVKTLLLDQGLIDELIPMAVPWLVDVSPWKKYTPFSLNWPVFVGRLFRLRRRGFDLSFPSGRSDIRYNLVLWLTGAKRRVGYGYAGAGYLLTDVVMPDIARPHQTEVCLRLLEHLGIETVRGTGFLKVPLDEANFAQNFLRDHEIGSDELIVGIHPGSRVASRTWGQDRFWRIAQHLSRQFGAKVIWFGDGPASVVNVFEPNVVATSLPLHQFLAVLARCSFLVCNDSGPMHMAGALGVPVVAIFGSTFPEWFRPPGENNRVVVRRDIPCRPCGDRCILAEPYCLRLISVDQVMQVVTETVNSLVRINVRAEDRE